MTTTASATCIQTTLMRAPLLAACTVCSSKEQTHTMQPTKVTNAFRNVHQISQITLFAQQVMHFALVLRNSLLVYFNFLLFLQQIQNLWTKFDLIFCMIMLGGNREWKSLNYVNATLAIIDFPGRLPCSHVRVSVSCDALLCSLLMRERRESM
jgi:hypothetical protein